MSLNTQYRSWTVQGNAAGSATYVASVGLFNYRLSAFDVGPGTTPRGQPFVVAAPTMTRGNVRERVAGSPSTEVSPQERIISGVTSPAIRNRFSLSFVGAGAGPGARRPPWISSPTLF